MYARTCCSRAMQALRHFNQVWRITAGKCVYCTIQGISNGLCAPTLQSSAVFELHLMQLCDVVCSSMQHWRVHMYICVLCVCVCVAGCAVVCTPETAGEVWLDNCGSLLSLHFYTTDGVKEGLACQTRRYVEGKGGLRRGEDDLRSDKKRIHRVAYKMK